MTDQRKRLPGSWTPPTVTEADDARQPGETVTGCAMRFYASHASRAVRDVERAAALRLDREADATLKEPDDA